MWTERLQTSTFSSKGHPLRQTFLVSRVLPFPSRGAQHDVSHLDVVCVT